MAHPSFERDGFAIVPSILCVDECSEIVPDKKATGPSGGSRDLLAAGWCASLARRLREHPVLRSLIPGDHVAVQCTYFEKSTEANWLVPIHQDLSIPVVARVDSTCLGGWSGKQGSLFVQAPRDVLEQMVAVRLHIDPCAAHDGALKVVPGSHVHGIVSPEDALAARTRLGEVICEAAAGWALVMRPLLLHASSKAQGSSRRRVLHFLYGPRRLPFGLRWQTEV